ncbi:hypothetical protein, partial [Alistipes ihumii]
KEQITEKIRVTLKNLNIRIFKRKALTASVRWYFNLLGGQKQARGTNGFSCSRSQRVRIQRTLSFLRIRLHDDLAAKRKTGEPKRELL